MVIGFKMSMGTIPDQSESLSHRDLQKDQLSPLSLLEQEDGNLDQHLEGDRDCLLTKL